MTKNDRDARDTERERVRTISVSDSSDRWNSLGDFDDE